MKYLLLLSFFFSCDSNNPDVSYEQHESRKMDARLAQTQRKKMSTNRSSMGELALRGGRSAETNVQVDGIFQNEELERKLIKKAYLTLKVEQLDSANSHVEHLLNGVDAYISSSNEYKDYRRRYNNLTIRIKSDGFDSVINKLVMLAENVDSRRVNVDDVTEQYIDTKIRLKNKKAVQIEYLRLLKKAKSVKDILNVQRELRQVREEIEAKEGLLKFYDHQISYSTIEVQLYQDIKFSVIEQNSFLKNVANAFYQGYKSFLSLVLNLIELWIYFILFAALILSYRKWKRVRN